MTRSTSFTVDLLKKIKHFIEDEETRNRYRSSSRDFIRDRGLSFVDLVQFLLQLGKSSVQQELDRFLDGQQKSYTGSALSQHRKKLSPEIFIDLNDLQVQHYYSQAPFIKKWKGYRLIAIDGSTMQLPYSEELVEEFGHFGTRTENNRKVVMGRISQAYDVLNGLTLEARLDHYRISELSLAEQHIPILNEHDLLLMDRGYAAFWLMSMLQCQSTKFVIRLKAQRWKIAKDFLASGVDEEFVTINPSTEARKKCKQKGIPSTPLQLRLVRVRIKEGEDHILITNLVNEQLYTSKELGNLYRLRWPIEESYKHLKLRGELENLSGKSKRVILQDFHRIIMMANLSNILSKTLTRRQVKHINDNRLGTYKLNLTQAFRKSKDLINSMFSDTIKNLIEKLRIFAFQLINQLEIIRPNRQVPRFRRYGGRPVNFMAYKP